MFDHLMQNQRSLSIWLVGLTLAVGLASPPAWAATPPDAGDALKSVKQRETQPSSDNVSSQVVVAEPESKVSPDNQQKILVKGFRLSGETILPEKELLQLIADQSGRKLTLADLNRLAGKLTQYMRQKGYPVATAYIPAQRVKDGIVEIAVVPGKYGELKLNNTGPVRTERLQTYLATLKPGSVIIRRSLERVLLLMNDLAGVRAKATLMPGTQTGTADLVVDVQALSRINGSLNADNWGSRYTGSKRGGIQLSLNNLTQLGEELELAGISSFSGLTNGNCQYDIPLGPSGLGMDLKYSHVNYKLGGEFANLDASGTADVYHVGLNYPLIRSQVFNLYGGISQKQKNFKDVKGSVNTDTPRASSIWQIGLSGNSRDAWLGGGANGFALTCSSGNLKIRDRSTALIDASSAKTTGYFHKIEVNGSRKQALVPNLQLNLMFSSQWASQNLDSSEKFTLGGVDGVRAYPQGEAEGDEGLRFTTELQWRIPQWSTEKNAIALVLFNDYGRVTIDKKPWNAGTNTRSLSNAGLGLSWSSASGYNLRCDYAFKLGNAKATSDTDNSGRFWIRGSKSF